MTIPPAEQNIREMTRRFEQSVRAVVVFLIIAGAVVTIVAVGGVMLFDGTQRDLVYGLYGAASITAGLLLRAHFHRQALVTYLLADMAASLRDRSSG